MGDKCSYAFVNGLLDVVCHIVFGLRDEKDAFMVQDDLLNQDSFVSGLKYIVVFNSKISWIIQTILSLIVFVLTYVFAYR